MFSEDGLCEVYSNIGEENMCYTCKTYPRFYNQVDNTLESSLTLSCIEVARHILLREDSIEFNLDIKDIDDARIDKGIKTINSKKLREKYFNEIRVFCIGLIQNRNYFIEERLAILGLFIKNINDITDESLLLETINTYNVNISNGEFNNLLEGINTDKILDAQLEFLTNIYKIILSKNIIDQRFLQDFIKVVKSLNLDSGDSVQVKENFLSALKNNYREFMKDYEYIYENYLVNYMFKTLFPISKMSLLDTYVNLIVHFSVIKMNLVGLCGYYKDDMDTEKVLHFIQSFAKVVEHDNFIVDKLNKYLSENDLNTFAHMVILMRI